VIALRVGTWFDPDEQIGRWRRALPEGPVAKALRGDGWVAVVSGPDAAIHPGPGGPIVLQGRLHYREDLVRALGTGIAPDASAVELAAAAFARWGDRAPAHLEGSWAFARWNADAGRLQYGPDHVSTVTLFHADVPGGHVVSTSLPHILACTGLVPRIDGQNLALLSCGYPSPGRTAWWGVRTAEPGRLATWDRDGTTASESWWDPVETPVREPATRAARDEAFAATWAAAVSECVGTSGKAGLFLSSGLDSTLVGGWAAPLLATRGRDLLAITETPDPALPLPEHPQRLLDEWESAHELASLHPNLRHERVLSGTDSLPELLGWIHDRFATPVRNSANYGWIRSGYRLASREGIEVMLWGARGNATVSFQPDVIDVQSESLLRGDFRPWLAYRPPRLDRSWLGEVLAQVLEGIDPRRREERTRRRVEGRTVPDALRGPFAPGLRDFLRAELLASLGRSALSRKAFVQHGARGFAADLGQVFGVGNADPTADRRVIEACLRRPLADHVRGRWSRIVARELGEGRVPDSIRWSTRRGMQAAELPSQFARDADSLREAWSVCLAEPGFGRLFDPVAATEILERLLAGGGRSGDARTMIRCLDIGLFLGHARLRYGCGELHLPSSGGTSP